MSTRKLPNHRLVRSVALLLAFVLLLPVFVLGASAQLVPGAQPPANQAPLPPPGTPPAPAATPAPTLPAGYGLCQCISDKQRLEFICPGSAQACQSACGDRFSFKPDAMCHVPAPTP